jgi:ssDNA-binding Zn-finger/Zn-ribbon topoisomerase 1
MEIEPNIVECECPRCGRKHFTFSKKISEGFFGICENCLTSDEKKEMLREARRAMGVKYQSMTGEKYSSKQQDEGEEVHEADREPKTVTSSS